MTTWIFRLSVITLLSAASLPAYAKKVAIFDLVYKKANTHHRYILIKDTEKKGHTLRFVDGTKVVNKPLSDYQAKNLQNYANHISWDSQYRKPTAVKNCTVFAQLKSRTSTAKVCTEDAVNTGKTFGLMNELYRIMK